MGLGSHTQISDRAIDFEEEITPYGTQGSSLAIAADRASGDSTNELKRGLTAATCR